MTKADTLSEHELIYNWNAAEKVSSLTPQRKFTLMDETLRDGIQSPSVVDPDIGDKLRFVELTDELGIEHMNIGLPGAGARAVDDSTRMVEFIRDNKLAVQPACAAVPAVHAATRPRFIAVPEASAPSHFSWRARPGASGLRTCSRPSSWATSARTALSRCQS